MEAEGAAEDEAEEEEEVVVAVDVEAGAGEEGSEDDGAVSDATALWWIVTSASSAVPLVTGAMGFATSRFGNRGWVGTAEGLRAVPEG